MTSSYLLNMRLLLNKLASRFNDIVITAVITIIMLPPAPTIYVASKDNSVTIEPTPIPYVVQYTLEHPPIPTPVEEPFITPILGVDVDTYRYMVDDNVITDYEKYLLYDNYYQPSPRKFISTATLYGNEISSYVELEYFGGVIRQQMWRGFVLSGSGKFGYNNIPIEDNLLEGQGSKAYLYYADMFKNDRNQPIQLSYSDLNDNQKRIYDCTKVRNWEIENSCIIPIDVMSKMTEDEALATGKYIGFVSTKSPNDFGRRFLLYKEDRFVGVVLVTGMAKRSDWTGLEKPTTDAFRYYANPLIIRRNNGVQWGFDFTQKLYNYFGGTGGPTQPILAVDPDWKDN